MPSTCHSLLHVYCSKSLFPEQCQLSTPQISLADMRLYDDKCEYALISDEITRYVWAEIRRQWHHVACLRHSRAYLPYDKSTSVP